MLINTYMEEMIKMKIGGSNRQNKHDYHAIISMNLIRDSI